MSLLRYRRRPGRASIKEGLDNLPSGICFADKNGMIVLCNRQMYRLCYELLGMDLQHLSELRRGLEAPRSGVRTVDGSKLIYRFPDNSLWQFFRQEITSAEGNLYTQIQAIDVTELHERIRELKKETKALNEANARAKLHYTALDQIVLEKETLAMKMRVHDEIGKCLLASHRLLSQNSTLVDYKTVGEQWVRTVSLMETAWHSGYAPQTIPAGEVLAEIVTSAREIGIRVIVKGSLPTSRDGAYLMTVAVRECITNAIRHAAATEMTVVFTGTNQADTVSITNNGRPPKGTIIEGGGLSSLRRSIEGKGGTMKVESAPVFRLTVSLPREENTI